VFIVEYARENVPDFISKPDNTLNPIPVILCVYQFTKITYDTNS
jgi:hypothetical protein